MLNDVARRFGLVGLVVVTVVAAAGCTVDRQAASGTAAASAAPGGPASSAARRSCATAVAAPENRMLRVTDVWPKSSSIVYGSTATDLDPVGCVSGTDLSGVGPNCSKPFPWTVGDAERTNEILAAGGIRTVVNATIRGHDPVARGTVIEPQEIREALMLRDAPDTTPTIVERFAAACAKRFTLSGVTAYRTTVRSVDTGGQIAAFLLVDDDHSIWLEFDDGGWAERDYLPVLKAALSRSA